MTTPSSWLAEALTPLIQGIKADIKKLGDLAALQTGDKASLVAAINWLKANQPAPVATRLRIGRVVTGLPGIPASAEIEGDAPEQTINFVIPKGDQGAAYAGTPSIDMVGDRLTVDGVPIGPHLTGPAGAAGSPGPAGAAGAAGADGHSPVLTWGSGADADRILVDGEASGPHLTGPAGAAGSPGPAGAAGAAGADGHSPVLTWGSGADADRIMVDGVASGPHLTGPAGGSGTISITGCCSVKPANGALLQSFGADRAYSLPTSLTGSRAWATNPATGTTVLTIKKNGTTIGTVTFAAGATTGTFSFATTAPFAIGDVLAVYGPSPADASWIGGYTLQGSYA